MLCPVAISLPSPLPQGVWESFWQPPRFYKPEPIRAAQLLPGPGCLCTCLQMTLLLLNPRNRNRYRCWAPSERSAGLSPRIFHPSVR